PEGVGPGVGLDRPQGGNPVLSAAGPILILDSDGGISLPAHSADGKYLAVTLYPSTPLNGQSRTIIYDTTNDVQLNLIGNENYAWSPAGHQLAVTAQDGVYWYADPSAPHPQKLTSAQCSNILWNPAP